MPKGVVAIAPCHHEKLDGSGYPRGLKAAEINDIARMSAIVDIFAALTDQHCHSGPLTPEAALTTMETEMADKVDLRLLAMFRKIVPDTIGTD